MQYTHHITYVVCNGVRRPIYQKVHSHERRGTLQNKGKVRNYQLWEVRTVRKALQRLDVGTLGGVYI